MTNRSINPVTSPAGGGEVFAADRVMTVEVGRAFIDAGVTGALPGSSRSPW